MARAGTVTGLDDTVLLHAGPAFDHPTDITRPILNSACVAAVYEGIAADFAEAESEIQAGHITLRPAQDHGIVTPLASVVSQSMSLHVIADAQKKGEGVAYAPINGGGGPAMRLGQRSEAVLEHVAWLNGFLADQLEKCMSEPLNLNEIARQGLEQGDDGHGRTVAMTQSLAQHIVQRLGSGSDTSSVSEFLSAGPSFFLNIWMAACKCCLGVASGQNGSSLVVSVGGNGKDFGLAIAGLPGRWFVAPASPPEGDLGDYPGERALGAIGDSAIVDVAGFGAMCMSYAPAQRAALEKFMPDTSHCLAEQLLGLEHPGFGALRLLFGLPALRVVNHRQAPAISLGILDCEGTAGRLGGGIFVPPLAPFEEAVAALQQIR